MNEQQPEALRLADRIDLKDYYEFDASLHCQKAAAELRRLHSVEKAFQQWITKTEWVQKSSQSHELGIHRADVMKQRLDQLLTENQQLRAALDQPQANQPAMTPIAQRKLDSLLEEGYTISGYSIYHERKHQHGFVTGAGLVGWWKPDGVEYPQPQGEQEPVAWMREDGKLALNDGGMFSSNWKPLYTHSQNLNCKSTQARLATLWGYVKPQPKRDPLTDEQEEVAFEEFWYEHTMETFPKDYDMSRFSIWGEKYKPYARKAWFARAAISKSNNIK